MFRISRKDLYYLAAMIVLVIIFFSDILFGGRSFWYRDLVRYLYPNRFLAVESLTQGQFPLWNPYIFCGAPLFANFQHGVLNPLSVLYYLFPLVFSLKLFVVGQFVVGTIPIYLLLRHLRLSSEACFVGAAIYIFSGQVLSTINLFTLLQSVIWLPVIYLLADEMMKRNSIWLGVLAGLVVIIQLFGGQPEVVVLDFLLVGLLLIWKTAIHPEYPYGRSLGYLGITVLIILLLAAVQILPFLEFVNFSTRKQGLYLKDALAFSLHPWEILSTILPGFSYIWLQLSMAARDLDASGFFLKNMNLGVITLVLVLYSFLKFKDRRFLFFAVLGMLTFLVVLGKYFFLYSLLFKYLPGFSLIRYPVKFIFLGVLAIAVLAALGFDLLQEKIRTNKAGGFRRVLLWLILVLVIGFSIFYGQWQFFENLFIRHLKDAWNKISLSPEFMRWTQILFKKLIWDAGLVLSLLLALLVWITLAIRGRLGGKASNLVFGIILLASLMLPSFQSETRVNDGDIKGQSSPITDFLKNQRGLFRIYIPGSTVEKIASMPLSKITDFLDVYRKLQIEDLGFVNHFAYAAGYDALKVRQLSNLVFFMSTQTTPSSTQLLNLFNVRYVISLKKLNDPSLVPMLAQNEVYFYRNSNCWERANIIPGQVILDDELDIQKHFRDPGFDLSKTVILQEPVHGQPGGGRGWADIVSYQDQAVEIETKTTGSGWLLLTDTYYPGWRAEIDRVKAHIYRADYAFRAVQVPAGIHHITFTYRPVSFYAGLAISLGCWLLLTVFVTIKISGGHYD